MEIKCTPSELKELMKIAPVKETGTIKIKQGKITNDFLEKMNQEKIQQFGL